MTRKEIRKDSGKSVFYVVKDGDINVGAIIGELSSMGCKGAELGEAHGRLTSADRCYTYKNPQTNDELLVIDEDSLGKGSSAPFVWLFLMIVLFGGMPLGNPLGNLIQELKKDGEEIR